MDNPQRLAGEQGRYGQRIARILLEDAGFEIVGENVPIGGVEADYLIRRPDVGDVFVSVKWSVRGDRPGLKRTDTMKKAMTEAWVIKRETGKPVVVMTNHIPSRGYGAQLLQHALDGMLFDAVIDMNGQASVDKLKLDGLDFLTSLG